MQSIKSFTIIASLALALSACSANEPSSTSDVQLDTVGAATQSDALIDCDNIWGWITGTGCSDEASADNYSAQRDRCIGLTNAPGSSWESPGTWDAENHACVDKWPSPICYGWLMNGCENTTTNATHQCTWWNVGCRVMCSKWNGMRFGGYCTAEWWTEHP